MTSALVREVSNHFLAPAALLLGKEPPSFHWKRGWVGLKIGLDDKERKKILPLPGPKL
jgi:hypothetical protein